MKQFVFKLNQNLKDRILTPIRTKHQLVILLLNAIKTIRINRFISDDDSVGKIMLTIAKMSRLSISMENKVFTFTFPFKVVESDGDIQVYSDSIGEIESVIISEAIEMFSDERLQNTSCISEFATYVLEKAELKPGFWPFIKELLFMEDGYVRYDIDPERENGHLHPEHHLDLFYSSRATFKVGLNNQINNDELIDILNTSTNCHYLSAP